MLLKDMDKEFMLNMWLWSTRPRKDVFFLESGLKDASVAGGNRSDGCWPQGFHLHPISGQSVQSAAVLDFKTMALEGAVMDWFFEAVIHHPNLLVKLRTEAEKLCQAESVCEQPL